MKKSGFASTLCQILYFFEYKVSPAPTGKEQPRQIYLAEAVLFPGGRWAERPSAADESCEATSSLRRRRSAARLRNTGRLRLVDETQAVCGLLAKRRRSAACWPSMGGLQPAGQAWAVCSLPAKHGRSAACRRSMDGLRPAGKATGVQEATRRGPPVTSHKPVSCGPFPDSLPQSLPFPQYNR